MYILYMLNLWMTWGFPKKWNMNSFGMFGMFGGQTWNPHMQGAMSGPLCKAISSIWRNSRIYFHKKNTFGGFMIPTSCCFHLKPYQNYQNWMIGTFAQQNTGKTIVSCRFCLKLSDWISPSGNPGQGRPGTTNQNLLWIHPETCTAVGQGISLFHLTCSLVQLLVFAAWLQTNPLSSRERRLVFKDLDWNLLFEGPTWAPGCWWDILVVVLL